MTARRPLRRLVAGLRSRTSARPERDRRAPGRATAWLLLLALGLATGSLLGAACASNESPDDPSWGSEETSPGELEREETDWEDRDADL